jgi:hypothetical protein
MLSAVVNCIGIGFQHMQQELVQNDASGAPTSPPRRNFSARATT